IAAREITQGRAALPNRIAQNILDRRDERRKARGGNAAGLAGGVDAGPIKRLVRVDVADSRHDPPVHEVLFNGDFSAAGDLSEVLVGEIRAEGLRADVSKQRMLFRMDGKDHAAETSRIVEPKAGTAVELKVHVIM